MNPPNGFIYILHSDDNKYLKVGFTGNLRKRFRAHQAYSTKEYGPLNLVGSFPATRSDDYTLRSKIKTVADRVAAHGRGWSMDWFIRNPDADRIISALPLIKQDITYRTVKKPSIPKGGRPVVPRPCVKCGKMCKSAREARKHCP